MDDTAYHAFAAHIAEHPLDPYGFDVFWYQHPQPANTVLAPPVFCYWLALGVRLFGESPIAWKLWMWPWCALFAAAVSSLARRFARPVAAPMAWFVVCSPAVLPAVNLMLDIPATALSLAALAWFLRVRLTSSWHGVLGVGVLTALAMQTKYTALLTPPTLLLAAWFVPRRRRRAAVTKAVLAGVIAVGLFLAWEAFVAATYGSSHFLNQLDRAGATWPRRLLLAWPLIGLLGGIGAPHALLGLTALGARTWVWTLVAVLVAVSWVVVAAVPDEVGWTLPLAGTAGLSANNLVFGWIGGLTLAVIVADVAKSLGGPAADRRSRFLACWWVIELLGYFALSPWPAVRRLIGLSIVSALFLGRQVGRQARPAARRQLIVAVAASAAFGLMYQVIDTSDALAERQAVEQTATVLRSADDRAPVWYVGHWGVQFYADRAGWRAVVPGESELPTGSWLVVPRRTDGAQRIEIPAAADLQLVVDVETPWPLGTIPAYYGKNKAIERRSGPAVRLHVYRVESTCVPRAP
jgi:4-amino-4-deoxy-L-arabinose transferase-like glycosyltransferase